MMKTAIICFTAQGADTAARIREALEGKPKDQNVLPGMEISEDGETTETGRALRDRESLKSRSFGQAEEFSARVWCAKSGFAPRSEACGDADCGPSGEQGISGRVEPLQLPLRQWTQEAFAEYDALIFVGAAGIAVRSIAPFLKSKICDPAVLCVDELGRFVIPLVSGHIGGANELAAQLADALGAEAVITTATDLNGRFAVDVFAKKNRLWISDMKLAKQISADVLDGKRIGFFSDFPVKGKLPEELEWRDAWTEERREEDARAGNDRARKGYGRPGGQMEARAERKAPAEGRGICITMDETKQPFEQTLTLIPRVVSIGIGCKKDADPSVIEEKIFAALRSCGVSMRSVERLASIDLKAREPGLLAFARKYGIEFVTYSAQELRKAPGEFSESAFVEAVTGVSNVCERSAVLASGGGQKRGQQEAGRNAVQTGGRDCGAGPSYDRDALPLCGGRLIQKKTAGDGVTVALAVRDWSVEFEQDLCGGYRSGRLRADDDPRG